MVKYAAGKRAIGYCDRCSWEYPLKSLKKERVNGEQQSLKVCPTCFDKDHPQNLIGKQNYEDSQALREPRVDTGLVDSRDGNSIVHLFKDGISGWVPTASSLELLNGYMRHSWTDIASALVGSSSFNFDSSVYKIIRVRIRINDPYSIAGSWSGSITWTTSTHDFGLKSLPPVQISMGETFIELAWDMSEESLWNNTIIAMSFILYSNPASTGSVDYEWIKIEEKII